MRTFSVTTYPNKTAVDDPRLVEGLTWDQLKAGLLPHAPYLDKGRVPCFSPHRLAPGQSRGDHGAGVVAMSWLSLDLDDGWTEPELVEHIANLDCAALYISSWSFQRPDKIKGRLIIPLDRDVLPSEWPMVWAAGVARYAKGKADKKCKDLSRIYYIPSYLEGSGYEPQRIEVDGPFASVERLILEAPPESNRRAGTTHITGTTPTKQTLGQLATKLQTSKKTEELGKAFALVVRGDAFAPPTERDNTIFDLVRKLVSYWPALDVTSTTELFAQSIGMMGSDGPGLDVVKEKLERAQKGMADERAGRTAQALHGRREPYTLDELQILADYFEIDVSQLRPRWIIQRGPYFYILVAKFHADGTLTPNYILRTKDDVENAALTFLAPAITAQVDPQIVTDRGTRTKNAGELVRDYGATASDVEIDMTAQFSYFDAERMVFVEAPCPLRVKEARYDPEIARLLELIGSKSAATHEGLKQWCAAATLLHRPCSALYLVGPSGIGKSLLAQGAARLWSTNHVSTLAEAFSNFNDTTGCHLILGDEASAEKGSLTGTNYTTSGLRQLIQSTHRRVNRKHKPMATIIGSPRIWLCANNANLLQTKERLTLEDAQAVAERFYYIDATCDDDEEHPAKTYLKQLGRKKIQTWIDEDKIAMHFLWLRDNIKIDPNERFIVQGQAIQLTQSITTNSGDNAALCQWIVSFLLNPSVFVNNQNIKKFIRVVGGALLINAKGVTDQWALYVENDRNPPDGTRVSKALSALSYKKKRSLRWKKESIAYRDVNLELVLNWAIATGFADEGSICAALKKLEKIPVPLDEADDE